jgi:pyruvate kinase
VKVQILCTLGPSSLRPDVIRRLDERGVDLFRVNLSHTPLEAVAPAIELIHGCSTVVRQANRWNRPVFVATNLLESMVTSRRATVAEPDDIANTLMDGVHGLVLAAETAIGVDPVGTVDMVLRVVAAFERWNMSSLLEEDRTPLVSVVAAR